MDSISKNDILAKLEALKIEHKVSSKKEDLYALLPTDVRAEIEKAAADELAKEEKEKADAEAAAKQKEADEAAAEEAKKAAPAPKSYKVANVFDKEGRFSRAYTEPIHGEDFEKLANEFVSDRPGYSVKMGEKSEAPVAAAPVKEKGVTAVVRKGVSVVRTFTKAIHGEDFAKVAEEFAGRRGMKVTVE